MKKTGRFILSLCMGASVALSALAHGDDKPGPAGGFIKMPGKYHIELIPQAKGMFKVRLLDLAFKNPTVKDSKLMLTLIQGNKQTPLTCKASADHFVCQGPASVTGKLWVKSQRLGQKGGDVFYVLPLHHHAAEHHHP